MDADFVSQVILMVLGSLLTIATPIVSVFLVQWMRKGIAKSEAALGAEHYEMARGILYDLVRSAKARGLNGEIDAAGDALRKYVMEKAQTVLDEKGIKFDLSQIEDLLESAYIDMTNESFELLEGELVESA